MIGDCAGFAASLCVAYVGVSVLSVLPVLSVCLLLVSVGLGWSSVSPCRDETEDQSKPSSFVSIVKGFIPSR